MLSDASTVELHHTERPSPPSAAAHAPPAALTPDPDPNAPHAAASPAVLTPAADDGPPAPVLCDSPAGVPSRRGLPMLSTAGSAVLEPGAGLISGLVQAAAHPESEAAQTASAPRALRGHAKPRQSGQELPERAWASGSPDSDEDLRPMASPLATAMQVGAQAEQQEAAGAAEGEHQGALAADRLFAGLPAACTARAGVMPGQHGEMEGVLAHAPSQTVPSCSAAEAGAAEHAALAAAHGEAGTSLLAEAGAAETDAAFGARTSAGAAPGATPGSAAAAVRMCGDATAAGSGGLKAPQAVAPNTDERAAAHGLVHAAAAPAMQGAASPALDSGDSVEACAVRFVHGRAKPGGDGLPRDPDPSHTPAAMGAGCSRAAGRGRDGAHADRDPNPATLHGPGAPALVQDALASGEPILREAGSGFRSQSILDPTTPSLPGEDALVGGEPVTPPGLLAAMAACGAGVGSTAVPTASEGLLEGSAEAELPPLDSAGRREVPPWLGPSYL